MQPFFVVEMLLRTRYALSTMALNCVLQHSGFLVDWWYLLVHIVVH